MLLFLPITLAGFFALGSDRESLQSKRFKHDMDRSRFMSLAARAGAIVIDTEPIFTRHIEASPLRLEVGPYDAHLNAMAVELVVRLAAAELSVDPSQP